MRFHFTTITRLIKELTNGLVKLNFGDNFDSFETTVTINASSVLAIRNELDVIPTKKIIVRQDLEAVISDSTTAWTTDFVQLENHNSSNNVTLTVIFFK